MGAVILATAAGFGWSQRELARRLDTNQSAIRRLQSGGRSMDVALATAALDLLGIRMILDADPIGLAGRAEQRDLVHARCSAYLHRHLTAWGWETKVEVEVGSGRYRGWIDLVAYRAADGGLLVIEVKTELRDAGQVLRTLAWYSRSIHDVAREAGWHPRSVVPALVALSTREMDVSLASNGGLLRVELPGGADALRSWIEDPSSPRPSPSVALIDPRSRRRDWLSRTTLDGRRRPAAYADYRTAAERIKSPDGRSERRGSRLQDAR
jgi:transcriptional regulator with XRE-family HTH domain